MTTLGSRGSGRLAVALSGRASSLVNLSSTEPLRLLSEQDRGECVRVRAATFGGGLVAGDAVSIDLDVGADASLFLGTAAPSKVFGAEPVNRATQRIEGRIASGGMLAYLPWPTTCFAHADYLQHHRFELAEGASLLVVDVIHAGRSSRGEHWDLARLDTTLELVTPKRRALKDRLLLDAAVAPIAPRLGTHRALATVALVGPRFADLAKAWRTTLDARPVLTRAPFVVTAGPMLDGLFLRAAADDPEFLDRFLAGFLAVPLTDVTGVDPWRARW